MIRAHQVPCFFIFGDSLVDNGNNNGILSLAKANYFPYGIDFPGGHTGRFCNGKSTVDVIAECLGFSEYIPAYAYATDQDIIRGVNYASAAAGIRDETGQHLGERFSFRMQLHNHKNVVSRIKKLLGSKADAFEHLAKCIYSVGLGSNDYLNNYFVPQSYSTARDYSPEQYAEALIKHYFHQIKTLYKHGARKVVVTGIGQIGCSPHALAYMSEDGRTCVQTVDIDVQLFNTKLKKMIEDLNNEFLDAKFIYVNAYDIFGDLLKRAQDYGFEVTNVGCCGVGRNHGQISCLPMETPCQNRSKFVFWDAFHPSEAANVIVGLRSYKAESESDVYPMDIYHLADLHIGE
ncbi:Lipase, GDSL [Cynara cardunculus var. scolymus]|uniref:Lipase, GDSL n=2 Tax=Cynara cardunculus var. scolymus TaxID=59895 RepID=A0A103Y1R9_CYNCS|nr:Lipase, GDSL [Cynara cardunculus var. scolymus]